MNFIGFTGEEFQFQVFAFQDDGESAGAESVECEADPAG